MEVVGFVVFLGLGLAVGGFAVRAALRKETGRLKAERDAMQTDLETARATREEREAEISHLKQEAAVRDERHRLEIENLNEKVAELKSIREQFETTFKALSSDALKANNERFIELAKENFTRFQDAAKGDLEKRQEAIGELLEPIKKSLGEVDSQIKAIEKEREGAYAGLKEQVRNLLQTQSHLQKETANLVTALRTPSVRGRWGEIQLERTVEFAGMVEHVDFIQQVSREAEDQRLRPDLIVNLPGGKQIVVDAKAPLDAYLSALEQEDADEKQKQLERHARQIRDHVKKLSAKNYWKEFEPAPEFVVLFLPGEAFFSAALEQDPELIQFGSQSNVLLATPTSLIALLRAAAYGWRQEAVAAEAREISAMGRELYERLSTQMGHYEDVGKGLKRAVDAYNKCLSSLNSRVLVTARKFETLSVDTGKEIPDLKPLDVQPTESGD